MNWEQIIAIGNRYEAAHRLADDLRQELHEAETEEAAAFVELEAALRSYQLNGPDKPTKLTKKATARDWTCPHCGKVMRFTSRKKHVGDRHPGAPIDAPPTNGHVAPEEQPAPFP